MICRFLKQTISTVNAQRTVPSAKTMTAHGGRNGQMALILKIALIVLGVTLGLSIFDALVVGLVYLIRTRADREKESEEEE